MSEIISGGKVAKGKAAFSLHKQMGVQVFLTTGHLTSVSQTANRTNAKC